MVATNAKDHKEQVEAKIAELKEEAAKLTGKENHSIRTVKGRAIAELRADPVYIDACRVAKGLAPMHGYFTIGFQKADGEEINADEAARMAAEAEAKLQELMPPSPQSHYHFTGLESEETLFRDWTKRMSKLESKLPLPMVDPDDVEELEAIAQEIVSYRLKLKHESGYRNKDLKADPRLHELEERLDTLAGVLLPPSNAVTEEPPAAGVEELRAWERRLTAKLAKFHKETQGLSPSAGKEVEQLLKEIAELKAVLRASGLTEHEQDRDEQVLMRLIRLSELRQYRHRDVKREKREHRELDAIREEVNVLQTKLDMHKKMLHTEQGLTHGDIKGDAAVNELEERLAALRTLSHSIAGA